MTTGEQIQGLFSCAWAGIFSVNSVTYTHLMYRTLHFDNVNKTLEVLGRRIDERFKNSGLANVCRELLKVFAETEEKLIFIAQPNYWLRASIAMIISSGILLIYYGFSHMEIHGDQVTFAEIIQVVEAAINDVVLISLALFFLFSLELRLKRAKAMRSLNELRAVAHIIDMHQLTKDPTEFGTKSSRTQSSPHRNMNRYQLQRYLDYCSEMLALIGKLAAIYAQRFPDNQVVTSVNEIENLTSGISRKIWQKIMILKSLQDID